MNYKIICDVVIDPSDVDDFIKILAQTPVTLKVISAEGGERGYLEIKFSSLDKIALTKVLNKIGFGDDYINKNLQIIN